MTDSLELLAQLIREDNGISSERALLWAQNQQRIVKALSEGRAIVTSRDGNVAPKYWTNSVFFTMRPTIVYGPQGQGKSWLCSYIILRAIIVNPKWDFYTNLPFFNFDYPEELKDMALPNVYLIRSMKELLEGIIRSRRADRIPAIILDEMDAEVDSYSWQSQESQSWRIFTQFQRHFFVKGPILVYHYAKHIPGYLRNGGMGRVVFLTYRQGKYYVLAGFTRPNKLVVTGYTPPYASHGGYPFTVNIDMRLLYRKLEGVSPQKILDSMESSLEESIITDDKVEKKLRETERAKAKEERHKKVISLKKMGLSQIKIAETLHMSKRDVKKILREIDIRTNGTDGTEDGAAEDSGTDKGN
jgi:hypothetical protein